MQADIFIVGAPKAGTTSLFDYLNAHPLVLGTMPKETHYFASDLDGIRFARTDDEYHARFVAKSKAGKPTATRYMDGSTNYLRSDVAIANIRRYNPDAKLIAMLRNPVDTVYAFHDTLLRVHAENIPDFERAWRLQDERRAGRHIPRWCREPKQLQYREYGMFAGQIERLQATFPPEQIKIILFDDFIRETLRVYREVLAFLGLPDDGRTTFDTRNPNVEIRSPFIDALIQYKYSPMNVVLRNARRVQVLAPFSLRVGNTLRRLNRQYNQVVKKRAPLPPQFRSELIDVFADDVRRLAALIGRDLDVWLHP